MSFKISLLAFLLTFTVFSCSKEKQTIRIYSNELIANLDPVKVTDRYSNIVVKSVYEGLYTYHYLKNELMPLVAESMPEKINELEYKITFRNNLFFSNNPCFKDGKGRKLVAQDFIYSMERLLSSTENNPSVRILKDILEGAEEFNSGKIKNISGLKLIDDRTINIKLKKPSGLFPDVFTLANTLIVPRESIEYYKEFTPIGSGPFYLAEHNEKEYILKRNPNYKRSYPSEGTLIDKKNGFLDDKGKPLPLSDEVIVKVITEENERWDAFKNNEIDLITVDKDSYFDAFNIKEELNEPFKKEGVKVHKSTQLDLKYVAFNMKDPLIANNKYLRQAISLTYDGYKHSALFFNSQAMVANWILPPGLFGFDPSYKNPYREHNVAKALELLKKAGYPNGKGLPKLTLYTFNSVAHKQMAEMFAKALGDIGIKLKIVQFDFAEFLKKMNAGKGYQLFTLQWRADIPFAEDFLQLLYGKAKSPGPNRSGFDNRDYNDLYEKMLTLRDSPEKLEIIKKMREIAVEECPIIPLVVPYRIVLTREYLKNYKIPPFNEYELKYLKLEK